MRTGHNESEFPDEFGTHSTPMSHLPAGTLDQNLLKPICRYHLFVLLFVIHKFSCLPVFYSFSAPYFFVPLQVLVSGRAFLLLTTCRTRQSAVLSGCSANRGGPGCTPAIKVGRQRLPPRAIRMMPGPRCSEEAVRPCRL